jgi:elongation factor G
MESYLASDGENITAEQLLPAIRRACLKGDVIPTMCGASLRYKGVEPLLDSVIAFLPSPHDRPPCVAVSNKGGQKKLISVDSNDMCALAFKIVHDPARGPLVFVRVYSGTLSSKQSLYNSTRGTRERINQLLLVSADDLDTIPSIGAGCVACIVGLKGTVTGDTLVADKGPLQTYVLDGLHVPPAVFSLAVEPERSSQQPELEAALAILCVEDPSLRIEVDKESGQTILRGIGELHLEIVCDKLRRQFNIEVTTGKAYVNYRESLFSAMGTVARTYTYDRTLGTKRMYAQISFEVTAKESAEEPDIVLVDAVKKQATPDELVSIIEGLKASFSRGPLGFPVTGVAVKVTQLDRDHDTTSGAVRACISLFIDSLLRSDDSALLEPIMAMEIELPTAFMGDVLSDLTVKRRGQVKDVVTREGTCTITADVPLATMLGYATAIRSMTQGEGNFSMEYDRHTAVDLATAQEYLNQ